MSKILKTQTLTNKPEPKNTLTSRSSYNESGKLLNLTYKENKI